MRAHALQDEVEWSESAAPVRGARPRTEPAPGTAAVPDPRRWLALVAASSAVGGLAPDAAVLFAARGLQGVFAAVLAPAALSLVAVTFVEPRERARAFAVYGAVAGGGGAVGLILGGLLTQYATWRWCLFVNVPIAAVALVTALRTVRESVPGGTARYDVPGALLVTTGSVSVVYGVSRAGGGTGWLDPATLALLGLGAVLLAGFVLAERRSVSPLLPLRVVTDRVRAGAFTASTLLSAGMFAMFLFLAYYLQRDRGLTPLLAGAAILPFSIGIIATATAASRLLPRFGPRRLMVSGLGAAALGMAWLAWLHTGYGYLATVFPAMVVMGTGLGLVFVPLSVTALSGIADRDAGVASAVLNASQQVGGAFGVALLNTLFTASLNRSGAAGLSTPQAHLAAYRLVFGVAAGLFLAALAAVAVAGPARARSRRTPSTEASDDGGKQRAADLTPTDSTTRGDQR